MHTVIASHRGRVHHAAQHPILGKARPIYCFIPEVHFGKTGYQKNLYLASQWPSINCGANPNAIGSHVFPDTERPAKTRSRCPVLREFLTRLETIASVKATQPAA